MRASAEGGRPASRRRSDLGARRRSHGGGRQPQGCAGACSARTSRRSGAGSAWLEPTIASAERSSPTCAASRAPPATPREPLLKRTGESDVPARSREGASPHLGAQFGIAGPELTSLRVMYRRHRTLFDHQGAALGMVGFGWLGPAERRVTVHVLHQETRTYRGSGAAERTSGAGSTTNGSWWGVIDVASGPRGQSRRGLASIVDKLPW
jgi:hypothetical protein